MSLSIEEFVNRFKAIMNKGWIQTHRRGPTGLGKTFEDLIGVEENNIQGPDFGEYEIKTTRKNSESMLTLITKSPDQKGANEMLRQKYGYSSIDKYGNTERVLHETLTAIRFTDIKNTGHKLKVTPIDDKIYIEDENGLTDVYWSTEILSQKIEGKFGNKFIYVKADNRGTGSDEEFRFESATLVEGIDPNKIIELLRNGSIYIDLRIGQYHDGTGRAHDHGTGMRIKEKDQHLLFEKTRILAQQ